MKHINISVSETYSIIKSKAKKKFLNIWKNQDFKNKELFEKPPTKLQVYSNNTEYDKMYTRLRLGASLLKNERYKPDKNCPFCNEPESFEHVFFECGNYSDQRTKIETELFKLGITIINKKTLLSPPSHSAEKIRELVFLFINETKINV
jgi:hypothetical protein